MIAVCRRLFGRFAPIFVAVGLLLGPATTDSVHAQPDPTATTAGEEGGGSGRPLDGYLATITLMLIALFVVGKSARR
jgi:hypothetical protein